MENPRKDVVTQSGSECPDSLVRAGLEAEEVRDVLLRGRKESRREFLRAIGFSGIAGLAFGIEAWGILRGEPFFGWLVPVLFTGFAVYFWSRRRQAESQVAALDDELRLLEVEREKIASEGGPTPEPLRAEGLLGSQGGRSSA